MVENIRVAFRGKTFRFEIDQVDDWEVVFIYSCTGKIHNYKYFLYSKTLDKFRGFLPNEDDSKYNTMSETQFKYSLKYQD